MAIRVLSPETTRTGPSRTPLRAEQPQLVPGAFGEGVARSLMQLHGATAALAQTVNAQEEQSKRFDALRRFSAFNVQRRSALQEISRQWQPGAGNLYEQVRENYMVAERNFLASLPPELQEEFSVRTAEVGAGLAFDTLKYQQELYDTEFREGIQDAVDAARVEIGQNAASLEQQRTYVDDVIESSSLGAAEKTAIRRKAYAGLEAVAYRAAQIERLRREAAGIGTDVGQAADLIAARGRTEREAERAAQRALDTAVASVGSVDAWAALPKRVRAALISTVAQGAGVPNEVMKVLGGDVLAMEEIAEAMRAAGFETEADLILNPEAAIDNDPAFSNVAYEDRLVLTEDAKRTVDAETAAQIKAEKAQNESLVNALHVALFDGTAGQADIDAMRERGILTDFEDIKKAQDLLEDRDGDLQLRLAAAQRLESGAVWSPGDTDQMKMLNAYIGDEGLAAIEARDSNYVANELIPLVRKSGLVPTDVENLLSGMIRNQDPQRAYWALDAMQQIERANPRAFMAFNEADRKAVAMWQSRKDYVSEEDMMKMIRGPLDPGEARARQELRKAGRELFTAENAPLKTFDARTLFQTPGFLGFPRTPDAHMWRAVNVQLNQEFQDLFLDFYEVTQDIEVSKRLAGDALKKAWGPTQVGQDGVLMKYPPEMVYPPVQDSYEWMEQQLRRDGILEEGQNFQLITDTETENDVQTGTPVGYLLVVMKDGVPTPIMGPDSLPMRVFFDVGAQEVADEEAWRRAQEVSLDVQLKGAEFDRAMQHQLDTGVMIPLGMGSAPPTYSAFEEDDVN